MLRFFLLAKGEKGVDRWDANGDEKQADKTSDDSCSQDRLTE